MMVWDEAGAISDANDALLAMILDMTMPNMTGEQTLERLRSTRTDVPVLLASGYSDVEVSRRFASGLIAGLLQKPFTPTMLAARMREILESGV